MAQIRHEINLINGSKTSTGTVDFEEKVQLDTTQYNGTVTYYFECVYSGAASNTGTLKLRRGTTDDASINGATSATVTMSRTSFTPPAGQTEYFARMVGDGTRSQTLKAARIVIIQNSTTITSAETQIEIGGARAVTTTSTTAVAPTSPKYWKYTAANWDGTKTFYFESTDAAGNTKSGVTVVLQTSASITAPSWSDVASSSHTNTSLSATRTRSSAITLTDGNWYRVAYSTGTSKSAATIYNAKIIIDQVQDGSNSNYFSSGANIQGGTAGAGETGQAEATAFKVATSASITGVKLNLKKVASPTDTLNIDLVSSLGGSSLANGTLSSSTLTTSFAQYTVTFGTPYTVTPATTYYIQITRSPDTRDATNYIVWQQTTKTPAYPDGNQWFRSNNSWTENSGTDVVWELTGASGITKLEPQYLLANTLFAAGTGLQTFLTNWDSTEWSGVTNTYYFQAEAADNSTSDVELWEADGGGSGLGVLTNIDNAQISSAVTMPASQNMDTKATTNAGDVAGARILVATVTNTASAAITGTVTDDSEVDIVTGGSTIIITLTGDTFIAAGTGPIGSTANTQALIDGIDSAQSEANGWDAVVRPGIETADVVRTSDTVATITLDAEATYNITANETITVTVPAAVLTGGVALVATPTFTITATVSTIPGTLLMMGLGT